MKTIKKSLRYTLYLVLVAVYAASCTPYKPQPCNQQKKYRTVIAKTVENIEGTAFDRGYLRYKVAFNDGWTENVTFGEYSCIENGDKILFTKCKPDSDYWWEAHINCN